MQNNAQPLTQNHLSHSLYHGTSTLFLESIITHGLGGINPVTNWNLLELAKEVYTLSKKHIKDTTVFERSSQSFENMTKQRAGEGFNWQHGNPYLSASKETAIRYSLSNAYGSELLTYTLEFLKELINLKKPEILKDIRKNNLKIFKLINTRHSPILIEVCNIPQEYLLSESGGSPKENINDIYELSGLESDERESYLRQCNFRLIKPITSENFRFFLINPKEFNDYIPKFSLYEIVKS